MATASFSFDPGTIPLARQPHAIVVQRYHAKITPADPPASYDSLPNVYCLSIAQKEGDPGSARFRYILSDVDFSSLSYPDGFEDLIDVKATSPFAVKVDDRIVVSAISADTGRQTLLFDGFAQSPEVAMSDRGQQVTFTALGVAIRCWDRPISGAAYRDANDPEEGTLTRTDLAVRFNPTDTTRGLTRANATPLLWDAGGTGGIGIGNGAYPLFVEPKIDGATEQDEEEEEDPDEVDDEALALDTRRTWTLGMAARYLLWQPHSNGGNAEQRYVSNGDTTKLDSLLQAIAPVAGGTMDPSDPSTYDAEDITLPDLDVSNTAWPEALKRIIWPHGLRFKFVLSTDGNGNPATQLQFYRLDGMMGLAPKPLKLQQQGDVVDPGQSNVGSIHIARGPVSCNRVVIETLPVLYEVAVILAPLFEIAAGDATDANRPKFIRSNYQIDFAGWEANRDFYRLFGYDECGDGHWSFKTNAWTTNPGGADGIDFDAVFAFDANNQNRVYTRRYRPGLAKLLSTKGNQPLGRPLRCQLHASRDYAGPASAVWDGTGTWQAITSGWTLLADRLGIYVDVDDPNSWNVGKPPKNTPNDQVGRGGVLNTVESLATPGGNHGLVYLRLTTVIESDEGLDVVATRRPASPTNYGVTARIDAQDHFRKYVIDVSSPYNPTGGAKGQQIIPRDDTAKAQAYAESVRAARELGHWAGSTTIPRLSLAYKLGDRLAGITGRTASFQANAGTEGGEGPFYPTITALSWDLDGKQATTLEFSREGIDPPLPD